VERAGEHPLDEVAAGRLDRFGFIDPDDGGRVRSGTLGVYYRQDGANGDTFKADAFAGRSLFDLSSWDVNGTPKIFPRSFGALLGLERDDDLLDAEFCAVCRRRDYPMIEVPIFATRRHGAKSTTGLRSAVAMYIGAYLLSRAMRERP